MSKHAIPLCALAFAAVTASSCGGGDSTGSNRTEVVQIGAIGFPVPDAICTDPNEGSEVSYQLEFFIEMVNTTKDSVAVLSVSSTGLVFGASRLADVNQPAHMFGSLPYEPNPVGLRAHDGDVTLHITMRVPCGTAEVTSEYSKTILTTLHIRTNSGEYNAGPLASHITWTHLLPLAGGKRSSTDTP